jgi:long-chain acyl-CoA synthetase
MTTESPPQYDEAPDRIEGIPALWARRTPQAAAIVDDRVRTWIELEAAVDAAAAHLRSLGVRPGDRVMVVGENGPAAVQMLFAVARAGAWVVNVNARLSAREIDAIRRHCTPRTVAFLLDSPDARGHAERAGAGEADGGGWGPRAFSATDHAAIPEPASGDAALDVGALLYTTGTTGEPKGVMLTHANLMFIARNSRSLRRLEPGDRVYGLLPLSHVYGLASVCLGTLFSGASLHPQARFAPASMAAFVTSHALTVCQGVPAMYAKLLEFLRAQGRTRFEAPSLRFIYAGGSPLSPALKRDVETFFGLPLHNGYGLTEASPTLTQTRPEAPRTDCSVGPAIPGIELRLVDPAGRDVPEGEPGELWARGPNVMKGYYRAPEATAEALRPGGWLATGDIARRAPDGAYFIEGRLKELIIRSGFNVFPVEVEAVLNSHPGVVQSAVVGRVTGGEEEVVAFVELAPGAQVSPRELIEFAGRSLAPYKRPAEVIVLPSLPAAANGKVLKGKLAQSLRERPVSP